MTDEEYDEWFSSLPELYQKMIKEGAVWMLSLIHISEPTRPY